jgi:hypothetical protein
MLIATALFTAVAFADTTVGVKKGDWIEYQVATTGSPPEDHNITWARMDVTGVQGDAISLNVQTRFRNGTLLLENITLNLATGVLGDDFFIPANLSPGDKFYDIYQGNINITSVGQLAAGGAQRTVVSGATNQTTYYWDRQTGILVAATSNEPEYTMSTKTSGTNIWEPQILGLDLTVFYALIIAIVIVVVAIVAILVWRRKMYS